MVKQIAYLSTSGFLNQLQVREDAFCCKVHGLPAFPDCSEFIVASLAFKGFVIDLHFLFLRCWGLNNFLYPVLLFELVWVLWELSQI